MLYEPTVLRDWRHPGGLAISYAAIGRRSYSERLGGCPGVRCRCGVHARTDTDELAGAEECLRLAIRASQIMMNNGIKSAYVAGLHDKLEQSGWHDVELSRYLDQWPQILATSPAHRLFAVEWWTGTESLHFSVIANFGELMQELYDLYEPKIGAIGLLVTSQELTDRLRVAALSFPIVVVTYNVGEPIEKVCERVHTLCKAIDDGAEQSAELVDPGSKLWKSVSTDSALLVRNSATLAVDRKDMRTARELYGRMITDQQKILGLEHPYTLATQSSLALLLQLVGDLDEARQIYAEVSGKQERLLGRDHPNTMRTRMSLASLVGGAGDAVAARDQFAALLADSKRVLGPDHPETLRIRGRLAYWTGAAGDAVAARDQFAALLADSERVLGPDHPITLDAREIVAEAYEAAEQRDEAIRLFARSLADRERFLGPDHPDTLTVRHNLAQAYELVERLDEAIPLYERALEDSERVLGSDHYDTLNTRSSLARAYKAAGLLDKAIPMHQSTVEDCERVLGSDHPQTLVARNDLANAYAADMRLD